MIGRHTILLQFPPHSHSDACGLSTHKKGEQMDEQAWGEGEFGEDLQLKYQFLHLSM